MSDLDNLNLILANTLANFHRDPEVTPATPAFRTAGQPTPFANANMERSNSIIAETNMLLDLYERALAYTRHRVSAFDVEEGAVLEILLTVYRIHKGVNANGSR